jgi:alkylation response protein AidB-like acyl-CoA dehydrogenase
VDVEVTHEEVMLRDATRSFLESRCPSARVRELAATAEGFDPKLWEEAAGLGWAAMLAPEAHGGAGAGSEGVVAAAILAEELGRALHPGPFLAVTVVIDAITRLGSDAQQRALLPSLVDGRTVATWAIADGPGSWDERGVRTTARSDDGVIVSGAKQWVQDAQNAAHLLVTCCRDDGAIVQVLVPTDTPGVAVTPVDTMDLGRRLAHVRFDDVAVAGDAILGGSGGGAEAVARQLRLAVVLQCAESVGATAQLLEKTVAYAKERLAFGRPIGSFQAVKHHLADAATLVEAAQAATWAAVRAVAADAGDATRAVHVAKAFVGSRCPHIVETCMQVHGGIAMTWEDDAHLVLRRVQSNRALFGAPAWHADRLCDVVGVAS